jgi:LmbE family N-acetylglucosaminyl deacetylase
LKHRVVVFSPHPDDDTLACGGTIAKAINEGDDVHVIFMTDGRNSHKVALGIRESPSPEEVRDIRRGEAEEAADELGLKRSNLVFLDFEDGSLPSRIQEARERVEENLLKLKPDKVFAPDRTDLHEDHRSTNLIISSAVKELALDPNLYTYVIWSNRWTRLRRSLTLPNRIEIDISRFLTLKLKAIDMHRSQVSLLFPSQRKPILDAYFLLEFRAPTESFIVKPAKRSGNMVC